MWCVRNWSGSKITQATAGMLRVGRLVRLRLQEVEKKNDPVVWFATMMSNKWWWVWKCGAGEERLTKESRKEELHRALCFHAVLCCSLQSSCTDTQCDASVCLLHHGEGCAEKFDGVWATGTVQCIQQGIQSSLTRTPAPDDTFPNKSQPFTTRTTPR